MILPLAGADLLAALHAAIGLSGRQPPPDGLDLDPAVPAKMDVEREIALSLTDARGESVVAWLADSRPKPSRNCSNA